MADDEPQRKPRFDTVNAPLSEEMYRHRDIAVRDEARRQRYVSEAVPFVTVGNRRALTDEQLIEHEHLARFVQRFARFFERAHNADAWLFIEPQVTADG